MNARVMLEIPQSIEAEHAVLGAVLVDRNGFDRIADILAADDFYVADHRAIFSAARVIFDRGQLVDVVSVFNELGRPSIGSGTDLPYLTSLTASSPGAANIRRHAEIVRRRAVLRALAGIGADLQTKASDPAAEPELIVAESDAALIATMDRTAGEPTVLSDAIGEALAYLEARDERGSEPRGLRTGIAGFDRLTSGLEPGQLLIVGARPSVGKTALATTIAATIASKGGAAYFHSLEMTKREIALRVLAMRSRVSTMDMRAGAMSQSAWSAVVREAGNADQQRLFIDDKEAVSVGYVRAKARRLARQRGLDLVIVDYLGLMRGTGENRVHELGSVSRGLKALAKELGVPIIALAQLNRGLESRPDKRPLLSDLRDSGEVEQDADIVAMLHRESVHADDAAWLGLAELIVRKNRNGPIGECLLDFDEMTGIFSDSSRPNPRASVAPTRTRRGLS